VTGGGFVEGIVPFGDEGSLLGTYLMVEKLDGLPIVS
jgi:hypothetical protein